MCQKFIFVLNNQEIDTPFDIKALNKLGNSISQEIFTGKYYVQSKVSPENFQAFLDYLYEKKENPELNLSNYYEFLLLSEEFNGNLKEYLDQKEFEKIKFLSILKNSRTEENRDLSFCEEFIASNLDHYLEFYSKEMSEMKTTTLYNIFQHEKRKLSNHERAYCFINELIKSGKNGNCVLLKTLNGLQLSEKSIKELFDKKESNYGYLPELNSSFILDIKNQMNFIMNQQIQMMNAISSMINEKTDSLQNNYLLLTQKIDESNDKIDAIITENSKVKTDIENLSQKIDQSNGKIDKLITKRPKAGTGIKNLSQKIDQSNDKIDTIITENSKVKTDIENLSKKINESNDKIGKIITESKKIGNIEKKVNETFTKIDGNSREINDIKAKIGLIKRKSSEIETKCNNIHSCALENKKSNTKILNTVCKNLQISASNCDGIIEQLTDECDGNVSDNGIVDVTLSSTGYNCNPSDVVNLENTELIGTKNSKNSWIKYDFKNKKVFPAYYLIRSVDQPKNWCHPKSWVIEGSNTDSPNDWKVLDSRKDCSLLNDYSVDQRFSIQQPSDFYRFLRIRLTDENWCTGNNQLCISMLEYYGFIQYY